MPSSCTQDAGRVIRPLLRTNPSAGSLRSHAFSRSMSLYRAGLRFALFLPLGVAIPPAHFRRAVAGFADVSPVVTLPLRAEATILLIEPASENATHAGLHA
jgi:hypothetical protein